MKFGFPSCKNIQKKTKAFLISSLATVFISSSNAAYAGNVDLGANDNANSKILKV
jgi:hypothetical protein